MGAVAVVTIEGPVDLATIPQLRDLLLRALAEHPGAMLVVDLDGVDGLDDTGLGVLLGAAGRAREGGGDLVVVTSQEAARRRLARTGFDRAITVAGGLAEVVG